MEGAIFIPNFQDLLLKALAQLYVDIQKLSRVLWVLHQGKEKLSGQFKHQFAEQDGTSHTTPCTTNMTVFWLTVTAQHWAT